MKIWLRIRFEFAQNPPGLANRGFKAVHYIGARTWPERERPRRRGSGMRFLLRMTFWLTIVCILLPRGQSEPASKVQVSATDAMSAATATVSDMRQFCERQPEACSVGSQAAAVIEDRAKAGAKRLYQMLNDRLSASDNDDGASAPPPVPATSIPLPPPRPVRRADHGGSEGAATSRSQNTLTPADLAPVWRGPAPRTAPATGLTG